MKVNIKKISEATGFSPATVSNALNHKKGVNMDTAAKIFEIAEKLGYVDKSNITEIRFVVYKKNGHIIDNTPFFPIMMDGAQEAARNCGLKMTSTIIDRRGDNFAEQLDSLIYDKTIGIILLGTELSDDDLKPFENAVCPVQIIDYWPANQDYNGVLINNSDSARMAVEYLAQKGHSKIGYLRGNVRIKAFRSREVGYMVGLQKAELKKEDKYTFTLSTQMDGAYKDMLEYLDKKVELPTAFFSDNDMIAFGAMKALQDRGVRVPEDISIIGFDDLPYCKIVSPRLTTIHVAVREMGAEAVHRLKHQIANPDAPNFKIQICTRLIERESVRDLNKK